MSYEKLNYKIIDNLPQKKIDKIDVQMINEMIEGYDTVQNTLDINSTNKYDLEIKKSSNNSQENKSYIISVNKFNYDSDNNIDYDIDYNDIDKKNNIIKASVPNNNLNPINAFYIGSLTIVGLFIFYRIVQKTK
jgi:hypothetical protein